MSDRISFRNCWMEYEVTVLDLYIYGDVLAAHRDNPKLREIVGDLRNPNDVKRAVDGCNAVIHLACISNDPSFDLDPGLGRSINFDCFRPLVQASRDARSEERRVGKELRSRW